MNLSPKLIDVFSRRFGEQYRACLTVETDMDDIEEWDSLSFIDLVMDLEDAFEVEFTNSESSQMFQLGHIQRIVNSAVLDLPHDDVSHAYCQIKMILDSPPERNKLVLLSTSSTREGLLDMKEINDLYAGGNEVDVDFYNLSISSLALSEMLQIVEALQKVENLFIMIGFSPFVFAGCSKADFERVASHSRFRLKCPVLDQLLKRFGYERLGDRVSEDLSVELWVSRYLKGRNMLDLKYNPYLYPTLEAWEEDHFIDENSFLKFYNNTIENHEESININRLVFAELVRLCRENSIKLSVLELPLHSVAKIHFKRYGDSVFKTDELLHEMKEKVDLAVFAIVNEAGILDEDYRDYGHIFKKQKEYTEALVRQTADWMRDG